MIVYRLWGAALLCGLPASALAQSAASDTAPPPAVTVSGSVALVSDYRFRGVSQSDREMAVQGGLTIAHDSGLLYRHLGIQPCRLGYVRWRQHGARPDRRLQGTSWRDNATLDVGLTWYMYPGGADKTDFAEPYVKLTGTAGPATLTAGVAYAPKQQAIGKWYDTGADAAAGVYTDPGDKDDNLYLWGDGAFADHRHAAHRQGACRP